MCSQLISKTLSCIHLNLSTTTYRSLTLANCCCLMPPSDADCLNAIILILTFSAEAGFVLSVSTFLTFRSDAQMLQPFLSRNVHIILISELKASHMLSGWQSLQLIAFLRTGRPAAHCINLGYCLNQVINNGKTSSS